MQPATISRTSLSGRPVEESRSRRIKRLLAAVPTLLILPIHFVSPGDHSIGASQFSICRKKKKTKPHSEIGMQDSGSAVPAKEGSEPAEQHGK